MQTQTRAALQAALKVVNDAAAKMSADVNSAIAEGHVPLVRLFAEFRDLRDDIKQAMKSLEVIETHLSRVDIPDAFKAAGIKSTTIEDVGRVTIGHLWTCSVIDGQREAAHQWLRDTGNEGLIIETVPAPRLAAFAKNRLETTGLEMPLDIFKPNITIYTSITKA